MEALNTAYEFDLPIEKMKCYSFLSELATARHDFRNSRIYYAKTDSLLIAIRSEQIVRTVKEMEAKYETAKKKFEIERQQQVIVRHNM